MLPDPQLAENRILFLACKKGQKKDKNIFATKSVQIISQIASKTFAKQCFFTDHLNLKTVEP